MPSVLKRCAVMALMVVSMVGCGSIAASYLDVNERAYKAIGTEYLELVGKSTATDAERAALGGVSDAAAVVSESLAAAEAKLATLPPGSPAAVEVAAEVDRGRKAAAALALVRRHLPHLDADQAQRRADSVLSWRSALLEARHHEDGGGGDREGLAPATPPAGGP